jgi:hypothetical protein
MLKWITVYNNIKFPILWLSCNKIFLSCHITPPYSLRLLQKSSSSQFRFPTHSLNSKFLSKVKCLVANKHNHLLTPQMQI